MRQRIRTAGDASERTNDIDIRAEEINARLDELDRHVRAPRKPEPPPLDYEGDSTWPVFAVFGAGVLGGAMAMLVGFVIAGWPFGSPKHENDVLSDQEVLVERIDALEERLAAYEARLIPVERTHQSFDSQALVNMQQQINRNTPKVERHAEILESTDRFGRIR